MRIDTDGRVLDTAQKPIPGLYAAGELVGGLFYFNYPGGTGLVSGSVFGKIAGTTAGQQVGRNSLTTSGKGSREMLELRPNCECCDRDLPPELGGRADLLV